MVFELNLFNFAQLRGKTQAEKVLWFLEEHGRITNKQCHEIFGIRHAPSVIKQIRTAFKDKKHKLYRQGLDIINEPKKGCNKFGEPTHWDDYVLVQVS